MTIDIPCTIGMSKLNCIAEDPLLQLLRELSWDNAYCSWKYMRAFLEVFTRSLERCRG